MFFLQNNTSTSGGMWLGVLFFLFSVGFVFYILGQVHIRLRRKEVLIKRKKYVKTTKRIKRTSTTSETISIQIKILPKRVEEISMRCLADSINGISFYVADKTHSFAQRYLWKFWELYIVHVQYVISGVVAKVSEKLVNSRFDRVVLGLLYTCGGKQKLQKRNITTLTYGYVICDRKRRQK